MASYAFAALFLAAMFSIAMSSSHCIEEDMTSETKGEALVIDTINKIEDSGIFAENFDFLRRMAVAQTNDGDSVDPARAGIWGISEDVYTMVNAYMNGVGEEEFGVQLRDILCFDWSTTIPKFDFLNKPLYSALTVLLHLASIDIIIDDDIESQAMIWKDTFAVDGANEQKFIDDAHKLLKENCDGNAVDMTLHSGAMGEDVVIATINKIEGSNIFADNFDFLQRMAAVETNYGETSAAPSGGIWGISMTELNFVNNYMKNLTAGQRLGKDFREIFCFDWVTTVTDISKMDVPFYSALAVMIHLASMDIIIDDDIESQAMIWKDTFAVVGANEQKYIDAAHELLRENCDGNAVDMTLQSGAMGEDVVIATINKIEGSNIFDDNFDFLQRMAAVETNYGETSAAPSGGIWGISMTELDFVNNYMKNLPAGQRLGKDFREIFCFDWVTTVTDISKMDVPFYSALAVMIHLHTSGTPITDNIESQAQVWKVTFNEDGDVQDFIDIAEGMQAEGIYSLFYHYYI